MDKIYQACEFYERLSKHASLVECLMFKKLIDSKLHGLNSFNFEPTLQNAHDLEFVSNYQAIQVQDLFVSIVLLIAAGSYFIYLQLLS